MLISFTWYLPGMKMKKTELLKKRKNSALRRCDVAVGEASRKAR
jgi:hypothetical protein